MYAQPQMPRKPYFMRIFQRKEMTKNGRNKEEICSVGVPIYYGKGGTAVSIG